ncbi:MAG: hypothetical protein ABR923_00955 [Terracidiphilus sp.]
MKSRDQRQQSARFIGVTRGVEVPTLEPEKAQGWGTDVIVLIDPLAY